jgi:hypothetical protein
MIKHTLDNLKVRILELKSSNPDWAQETSELIDRLQKEINELDEQHHEKAISITNFTQSSIHESIRSDPQIDMRDLSLSGLQRSIFGFETSHPQLVSTVNDICTRLSQLGI